MKWATKPLFWINEIATMTRLMIGSSLWIQWFLCHNHKSKATVYCHVSETEKSWFSSKINLSAFHLIVLHGDFVQLASVSVRWMIQIWINIYWKKTCTVWAGAKNCYLFWQPVLKKARKLRSIHKRKLVTTLSNTSTMNWNWTVFLIKLSGGLIIQCQSNKSVLHAWRHSTLA